MGEVVQAHLTCPSLPLAIIPDPRGPCLQAAGVLETISPHAGIDGGLDNRFVSDTRQRPQIGV